MRAALYETSEGRWIVNCRDESSIAWTRVLGQHILGRELRETEIVHHVDRNPGNDSHDNLVICTEQYHKSVLHRYDTGRGGAPVKTVCKNGHYLTNDNVFIHTDGYRRCKRCTDLNNQTRHLIEKYSSLEKRMQMHNLVKTIDNMTDEELLERVREMRHRRETLRPARADRIARVEKKTSRTRVKKTTDLLDGLTDDERQKLIELLSQGE